MKKCIVSIAKQIYSSCRLCVIVSKFDGATQERVQTCIVRGQTETVPRWRTVDQLANHRGMESDLYSAPWHFKTDWNVARWISSFIEIMIPLHLSLIHI